MTNVNFIQSKSVITRLGGPHPLFRIDASLNPYYGCSAGCLYCPFTVKNKIGVKTNYLALLETRLKAQKETLHLGIGTACEPYCGEEADFRLTRSTIELAQKYEMPVQIFTKSERVLDDMDLLVKMSRAAQLAVTVSVFTTDRKTERVFEPNAEPASERLKLVRKLRKKGVFAGVALAPIIPFINDSRQQITELFARIARTDADYVLPAAFCMRDAKLAQRVEGVFLKHFPQREIGFHSVYYRSRLPDAAHSAWLNEYIEGMGAKHKLPLSIPIEGVVPPRVKVSQELPD